MDEQKLFIQAIDRMMVSLGSESARASAAMRNAYRDFDQLVLAQYSALEGALANGGVVPLPPQPSRFNVKPRVEGQYPIGEKDLDNQPSYISARPATIGCLLEIASRVKSGPVEITSMVRHSEYQDALRTTNRNANTSVPTHTMGLAFDIALINTPLPTIYEIRDVLQEMQRAGDIIVIGERRQLVFHVVPHPSRLGHFTGVYARVMAEATPGANIVAATPVGGLRAYPAMVETEIIAVRPTEAFLEEWWAADGARSDLTVEVSSPSGMPGMVAVTVSGSRVARFAARWRGLMSGLFQAARGFGR